MTDLAAFVPRLATELAIDRRSTWTKIEGSMLSADISGFTALSEKLVGTGRQPYFRPNVPDDTPEFTVCVCLRTHRDNG
jgi:hypothetical protein